MFKGKNIIVAVTGGIAAYKSADLVSKLSKEHANVKVVMTEAATEFITPLTMQTLSKGKVYVDIFDTPLNYDVEHISLAKWADLIIIAPATANIIAKLANGIADDMLSTMVLATKAKVMLVPAMNTNMYQHPATKENICKVKEFGYHVMEPATGLLACGDVGEGKMPEVKEIIDEIEYVLTPKDLIGRRFIVTAGPTIESLDPVRYLTNHSSGKMGYAIAREAYVRGAEVVLVKGYTTTKEPKVSKVCAIKTTKEMLETIKKYFDDSDVLVKAAAPADYTPTVFSEEKIKKEGEGKDELHLDFVANPDVAKYFGSIKKKGQVIVGFAAETTNLKENAAGKLANKNLDFIVANDLTKEGAGFRSDTNVVTIFTDKGEQFELPRLSKREVAKEIVNRISQRLIK